MFSVVKKAEVSISLSNTRKEIPKVFLSEDDFQGSRYALVSVKKKGKNDRVWYPYFPKVLETSNSKVEILDTLDLIKDKWSNHTIRRPLCILLVENTQGSSNLSVQSYCFLGKGEPQNRPFKTEFLG